MKLRRRKQEYVVSHPDIGVDSQPMRTRRLSERVAKKPVIRIGRKNGLSIVPALDDVLRLAWNYIAGETCHDKCLK
jgi:hypothetical protein